jgi:hypothetical protein
MSRFTHRVWVGQTNPDGSGYRIQAYEDSEMGWSFICRPTIRGQVNTQVGDLEDYCALHLGAFQSFGEACRGAEDHERRKHLIRAVA